MILSTLPSQTFDAATGSASSALWPQLLIAAAMGVCAWLVIRAERRRPLAATGHAPLRPPPARPYSPEIDETGPFACPYPDCRFCAPEANGRAS